MYTEIKRCRICGNPELAPILNLGDQYLTGIFPKSKSQKLSSGPLELVKCCADQEGSTCGLVQLRHSFNLNEMYGDNYGYRSGLNQSMVHHLHGKVRKIQNMVDLNVGDLVIDIGSNDSTLLQGYGKSDCILVGVDPTGNKFRPYYPDHICLIPDYFSATAIRNHFPGKKAKVITSISMFYDLETPSDFMREIYDVLDDDGIWVFEQSYMPEMLVMNAFDTVCQEHIEYYGLSQIKWMTDRTGFSIIDVEFNDVNGGSFSVTVSKKNSKYAVAGNLSILLQKEQERGLATLQPYQDFAEQISLVKENLLAFLRNVRQHGKTVMGLGASTKGNVVLQYCGITEQDLPFIGDVNPDKFGCYTPGTMIPIVQESEVLAHNPDYLLVLPWHFKDFFLSCKHLRGRNLVFPLPKLEIIRV